MGYWLRLSMSHPVEGLADFTEAKGVISTLIAWQAGMGNRNRTNYLVSLRLKFPCKEGFSELELSSVVEHTQGPGFNPCHYSFLKK